jgi:hypothetical protein
VKTSIVVFGIVSVLLTMPSAGIAQQTIDSASVGGRVVDQSGAVVPGAEVTARHLDTNVVSSTTTDLDGRFRFPYLRIGRYEVIVRLPGFRPAAQPLTATAGAAFELPFTLALEGIDASVTVSAAPAPLETARTQIATTVLMDEVDALPLNGRNFLDVALLAPGVAPTNIASTQLFAETSAVPGNSISVNSQRNLSNNFIVDGLSANDDAAALSGITYSVEAIEQFQIVTSGGQAELGRALGGYINVVTKSGTNAVRASLYDFVRHDALNARHALSRTRLPMRQWQFGGTLGGPLARDRTFYFANVEHRALDQTGLTTVHEADVQAINERLRATRYPGPRLETGAYQTPVDTTNALVKVDHHVGPRSQLGVRYALYSVTARNARGVGALNTPSASSHLDNLDQSAAVSHLQFLTSRTVLETRAQFAHSDLAAPPSDLVGPAVNIAGVATFGTSSSSPTSRRNTMVQAVSNLSHQRGAHAIRIGVDVLYNDDTIRFPRSTRGAYTFSSLETFLSGTYNNAGFTQTFGASEVRQANPNVGVYVQDEWKATPRITINAGLRYDLQFLDTIETDRNNLSPRVGVAIAPFDPQHTVIRASAGLFFDRVPLRALANALLSAGNSTDPSRMRQIAVTLSPTQAGAPAFPGTLTAPVATVTLPNLTTMDHNLQNAYARQGSLELEQQIGERATLSVGYEYVRGLNLLMSVNQNVPTCVATGTNNGCRPDPNYANNGQYSSVGDSNYHGLHFSWLQRPTRWGHYRVSYTWSKSMNNVGEFFFSGPIDPTDLSKDWGRSDNDRRHRLVVNTGVEVFGLQVSALAQAYSAGPLNITSGTTTLQGTSGRPRVNGEFIARNAGEGSAFFTLGARLSRTFRIGERLQLEGLIEGFNLTNRTNVLTRNTNFGAGAYPDSPSSNFLQVTSVGEPRSLQLGVKARF